MEDSIKFSTIWTICVLLISSNISAQDNINYGLKFGMVSSDIIFKNNLSSESSLFEKNRLGPILGIFVDYQVNTFVTFDLDLMYLQKGAEDEVKIRTLVPPVETLMIDYQIDYLQMNMSINPKIKLNQIEIQGKLGLSLNLLLGLRGYYLLDNADDFSPGYLFGGKIIFNDILKRPFYIEVIRNIDFNPFFKSDIYDLTNEIWMFNLGFYYN